jgi:hypothetical protein
MTDRLAELEAKAAALNSEIAALKAERPAPPPSPRDEVRIVPVLDETRVLPDLKQMQKLFGIVRNLSPWPQALVDRFDEERPFRAFSSCFRWLSNKGRAEFPNPRFALGFWLDDCRAWLRARNSVASDLDANALILATYASGDIAYVPANPTLGHTWELALGEHAGRRASPDAWKRVLQQGASAIMPPNAPARRFAPSAAVRIVAG